MSDEQHESSQPQGAYTLTPHDDATDSGNSQMLIGGLIVAGVIIGGLLVLLFGAGNPGSGDAMAPGGPVVTLPAPAPGQPAITVTAGDGVNVRTGPGTDYEVVGILPQGSQAPVIGRNQNGDWWVINVPVTAGNQGWVAAAYVEARDVDDVPIVLPPGEEPGQGPVIAFTAEPTTIEAGQCTTLQWTVENVREVYVYPAGASWADYGAAGTGARSECPAESTTYEMRVVMQNGAVDTRQVTVTVTTENVDPLAGTNWWLTALQVNQLPIPATTITLMFDLASGASGDGGCNPYSGAYSANGGALTFGPLISGMAACGSEIDGQEQLYLRLLQTVSRFEVSDDALVMFDAAGQEILRFGTTVRDQ